MRLEDLYIPYRELSYAQRIALIKKIRYSREVERPAAKRRERNAPEAKAKKKKIDEALAALTPQEIQELMEKFQ
jgi:hypothetical protein